MHYKALILDLDGTAIPHKEDGKPSPRVVQAIKNLQAYIPVCVSTSRPLFMARPVIEALGIQGVSAVNDATQLYDPMKKEITETLFLPEEVISNIQSIYTSMSLPFMVNVGDKEYVYDGGDLPKNICVLCAFDVTLDVANILIEQLSKIPGIAAVKVPSFKKGLVWVSASPANATKLHSVVSIAKTLAIKTKEIVGIGDGYNDFPLLEACGLKIAMRNAVEELKSIADFICPSVDNDGVAIVIEKILLPMVSR